MNRKPVLISIILLLAMALGACSSASSTMQKTAARVTSQPAIEDHLAAGILKLEGTGAAVTAQQAGELLFLWKAVASLGADSNTASSEISALYTQIAGSLTSEQVKAIKAMNITSAEVNALEKQYGAAGGASGSTDASSTSQVSSPGGEMPPDGGIMGGGDLMGGGPQGGSNSSSAAAATGSTTVSSNVRLAEAVIKMLEAKTADL